ncbi:MAG: type III-A CRISPR-associated RAMP protein Csm5 [Bryobacteraceae bacterium]
MSVARYRAECLTPVLVGDGSALSPIDYMVWKDQVNVLDQRRIFKLLAKGSRLDGYLSQVKRAERLDFASWGGFAQNFAERRIPFEDPSCTEHWNRLRAEDCFIPTFARQLGGPFLPGSAIRGALRTTMVAAGLQKKGIATVETLAGSGGGTRRRLGEAVEQKVMGGAAGPAGLDPMKALAIGDSSQPGDGGKFRVYMVRTATLVEGKGQGGRLGLGWKHSMRGTVDASRVSEAGAIFAEMADPGLTFEGPWTERGFYESGDTVRSLGWKEGYSRERLFEAANQYAETALAHHRGFAELTGLARLSECLETVQGKVEAARAQGNACVLSVGWGGGMLGKTAWPQVGDATFRKILSEHPFYSRAIRSGMPFPKTRRVVFQGKEPAALPGWIWLELE